MWDTNCDGQSKRENQKALTVPAPIFPSISLSLSNGIKLFRIFFFQQKHIPCCLFVALFLSCFSALFHWGACRKSFYFFLFSRTNSVGLRFACIANHMQRREGKNHRLSFTCLLLEHFISVFIWFTAGRRGKKEKWVRWREKILKISPTSDRSARPIIRKNLHIKFVSLSPLGVVFRARWEAKRALTLVGAAIRIFRVALLLSAFFLSVSCRAKSF